MKRLALTIVTVTAFFARSLSAESYSEATAANYARSQNWNGLIQYARNWSAADPQSPKPWFYLAAAYFQSGDVESSIAPHRKAVSVDANFKPSWEGLGHAFDRLNRFSDAADAFEHCLNLRPTAVDYWNAITANLNARRVDQTAAVLDRERRQPVNSNDAHEWYNIAVGYDALGRLGDARPAYQRALQLNPQIGAAWNNLGVIEQKSGNANGAMQDYQRAASLGEPLGASNAQNLQAGLQALEQQNNGSRQVTPQMVQNYIRIGQAKSWATNHPGSLAEPYGKPW